MCREWHIDDVETDDFGETKKQIMLVCGVGIKYPTLPRELATSRVPEARNS